MSCPGLKPVVLDIFGSKTQRPPNLNTIRKTYSYANDLFFDPLKYYDNIDALEVFFFIGIENLRYSLIKISTAMLIYKYIYTPMAC